MPSIEEKEPLPDFIIRPVPGGRFELSMKVRPIIATGTILNPGATMLGRPEMEVIGDYVTEQAARQEAKHLCSPTLKLQKDQL